MLEDDFTYVIRKALKGLDLAPSVAAAKAGLSERDVQALLRGRFSADTARRLAPVLGLIPEALSGHPNYHPAALSLDSIHRLDLPFGEERVNAWSVRVGDGVWLFDTGDDPFSCRDALAQLDHPAPSRVFITHGHVDHVSGLAAFPPETCFGLDIPGAKPFQPGESYREHGMILTAFDLSGHATPSLGYFIEGLSAPILVTGDALFAGSIGGCEPARYHHALDRLRQVLAPLPDETILFPGHGPASTLGEERRHNPFPIDIVSYK